MVVLKSMTSIRLQDNKFIVFVCANKLIVCMGMLLLEMSSSFRGIP